MEQRYALTQWAQLHVPEDLPLKTDPQVAALVWRLGRDDRIDTGLPASALACSVPTLRRAMTLGWVEEI